MIEYRNTKTGRVTARHAPDEWLEASSGWERVDESDHEPGPASAADGHEPDDKERGND